MTNKKYRGSLSFKKSEIFGNVRIGSTGLSMAIPKAKADFEAMKAEFITTKDWLNMDGGSYDPDMLPADVAPKPEDFIEVPFRLLSATIVGGETWKATDFSDVSVLRQSVGMLEGKTVYTDHEQEVGNWVGIVKGVKWSEAFMSDGTNVPAGIDGLLAIDAKTAPTIARGLLLGSIYSNSVTVDFEYEMSHQFENEWDFIYNIGNYGKDGKMIRRIVTKILDYHETSLVWLGADPFSKAYNSDGSLKNIERAAVYSFAKASNSKLAPMDNVKLDEEVAELQEAIKEGRNKTFSINFGMDRNLIPLSRKRAPKIDTEMKSFALAFIKAHGKQLGLSFTVADDATELNLTEEQEAELTEAMQKLGTPATEPTAEDAEAISYGKALKPLAMSANFSVEKAEEFTIVTKATVEALQADKTALEASKADLAAEKVALEAEKVTLSEAKASLEAKLAESTKLATVGTKYIEMKREEAIRLYKATVGADKAQDSVVALMKSADDEALNGLIQAHTKTATEKFGGKCAKCGSHEFSFQSSLVEPVKVASVSSPSGADLYKEFSKRPMNLLGDK